MLRFAIRQDLHRVVVDLDEIVGQTLSAINVVEKMNEGIVRNCLLVVLKHAPFRFAAKNAKIFSATREAGQDRQQDRQCDKESFHTGK